MYHVTYHVMSGSAPKSRLDRTRCHRLAKFARVKRGALRLGETMEGEMQSTRLLSNGCGGRVGEREVGGREGTHSAISLILPG